MTDRKRPRQTPSDLASEQVTERLNALYGGGDPGSALDEVLEALQFLSLPADDEWDEPGDTQRKPR